MALSRTVLDVLVLSASIIAGAVGVGKIIGGHEIGVAWIALWLSLTNALITMSE